MSNAAIMESLMECQASLHSWGRANRVIFDAGKEETMVISTVGGRWWTCQAVRHWVRQQINNVNCHAQMCDFSCTKSQSVASRTPVLFYRWPGDALQEPRLVIYRVSHSGHTLCFHKRIQWHRRLLGALLTSNWFDWSFGFHGVQPGTAFRKTGYSYVGMHS